MSKAPSNAREAEQLDVESWPAAPPWRPEIFSVLAWLVPGLGHWMLGRRGRGLAFFGLVVGAMIIGAMLEGELGTSLGAPPLSALRTLGCMAAGVPYAVLRFVFDYAGSGQAAGYEYGSAFLVSSGVMNFLLVLDVHDIAIGRKA